VLLLPKITPGALESCPNDVPSVTLSPSILSDVARNAKDFSDCPMSTCRVLDTSDTPTDRASEAIFEICPNTPTPEVSDTEIVTVSEALICVTFSTDEESATDRVRESAAAWATVTWRPSVTVNDSASLVLMLTVTLDASLTLRLGLSVVATKIPIGEDTSVTVRDRVSLTPGPEVRLLESATETVRESLATSGTVTALLSDTAILRLSERDSVEVDDDVSETVRLRLSEAATVIPVVLVPSVTVRVRPSIADLFTNPVSTEDTSATVSDRASVVDIGTVTAETSDTDTPRASVVEIVDLLELLSATEIDRPSVVATFDVLEDTSATDSVRLSEATIGTVTADTSATDSVSESTRLRVLVDVDTSDTDSVSASVVLT
jgi:hypothetical protein